MARSPVFRLLVKALQEARRRNLAEAGAPAPRPGRGPAITRRSLLAGAGAAVATGIAVRHVPVFGQTPRRIAVVGAGIAGLAAAHHLVAAGHEVKIFESRDRVGGRMFTRRDTFDNGLLADMGGELVNTDHLDMHGLCKAYGVGLFDRVAAIESLPVPEWAIWLEGRMVREGELAEALRGIAGQIMADADRVDADDEAFAAIDALSTAAYLDRHQDLMPQTIARTALELGMRTEYGLEPAEASAISLIYNLPTVDGERVDLIQADELFSIEGGSQSLPEAIAGKLGDRIALRNRVSRIADDGAGVTIEAAGGTERFDGAVVAMPNPPLRRVALEGELPDLFRSFVAEFGPGDNEKLVAAFNGRPWRQAGTFANEMWSDSAVTLAWDSSLRQPELDQAVLTIFFGGATAKRMQPMSAADVADLAFGALEPAVPGLTAASTGQYLKTAWHRDRNTGGAYCCYRPGQVTAFGELFWGLEDPQAEDSGPVFGRLAFAGEHLSDTYGGYMNGGAETGRRAAAVLSRMLAAG